MQRTPPAMTAEFLAQATARAARRVQAIIEQGRRLAGDASRQERHDRQLCSACFYREPHIAGAAMTSQPCACCGTPQMYCSTATDVLCHECAQAHRLCKHCGGDLEMNVARKDWPQSSMAGQPRLQSNALWPDGVCSSKYGDNISSDTHLDEGHAQAVCDALRREGFGGERRHFPLRTWVSPIEDPPHLPPEDDACAC